MTALVVACMLAAMLGFAAHRASVCTVRAVAEVITSRTCHMLVSIGKSMLWVVALAAPVRYPKSFAPCAAGFSCPCAGRRARIAGHARVACD